MAHGGCQLTARRSALRLCWARQPFCVVFACFLCLGVGFFRVLWFPKSKAMQHRWTGDCELTMSVNVCNTGSLEKHASSYIFAKLIPIYTNHFSFQAKWALEAIKHQHLSFLFTQIMITRADYQLIKTLWPQNTFTIVHGF